jgi:hypothetical protein
MLSLSLAISPISYAAFSFASHAGCHWYFIDWLRHISHFIFIDISFHYAITFDYWLIHYADWCHSQAELHFSQPYSLLSCRQPDIDIFSAFGQADTLSLSPLFHMPSPTMVFRHYFAMPMAIIFIISLLLFSFRHYATLIINWYCHYWFSLRHWHILPFRHYAFTHYALQLMIIDITLITLAIIDYWYFINISHIFILITLSIISLIAIITLFHYCWYFIIDAITD